MDYFSLSKVKQNVFKQGKKIENKVAERVPLLMDVSVFLSSHWVGRWVGGLLPCF